jgi:hypothetical protein
MHEMTRRMSKALVLGTALAATALPAASAVAAGKAAAAKHVFPRKGAAFAGVSSQKSGTVPLPLDIRASPNGTYVSRFDIEWSATCTSPTGRGSYGGLSITLNKQIKSSVFTDSGSFTRSFSNGDKGTFNIKLFGKFTSPLRAAGTFQVNATIVDSAGALTDTCSSGVVNWVATN